MQQEKVLMDEMAVNRALSRIAHEIIEKNHGTNDVALVGIVTRGVPMAEIIAENIKKFEGVNLPAGSIDISLYRDDIKEIHPSPVVNATNVPFSIENKHIVLCDDVIFTGRTVRAAIDALLKIGRPKTIQLAVLIDRGHRELPIRADYVGKNVPTTLSEMIDVNFIATDKKQNVLLYNLD